jgi:hypothetical protein
MKKFLEELSKASNYMYDAIPTDTDAERKYQELRAKFTSLVGRRALYVSKTEKESRVVVIKQVRPHYVILSYKYYGLDYQGELNTCVGYGALICGEDRLDVE